MSRNNRFSTLDSFLDFLGNSLNWKFNREEFDDRFLLQKYVFFAQKFGLDSDYSYNVYVFGAYSRELAQDYYSEELSQQTNADDLSDSFRSEEFVDLVRNRNARWLEIASTLTLYYDRFQNLDAEKQRSTSLEKTMQDKNATRNTVEAIERSLSDRNLLQ